MDVPTLREKQKQQREDELMEQIYACMQERLTLEQAEARIGLCRTAISARVRRRGMKWPKGRRHQRREGANTANHSPKDTHQFRSELARRVLSVFWVPGAL